MDPIHNYLEFEPITSFKDAILAIHDPQNALKSFFSHKLTFGTAGLRGIMQPGSSGINGYTIAQAAHALGQYIKKLHPQKHLSVCISYDNRHHSMQFADICARVLAHSGISVKLSRHLRPTPWLSFAIKELGCDAGIMITASHNPKQYNGFKAYLHDGGQIVSPHDKEIMKLIDKTHEFYLSTPNSPLIELIDDLVDHKYLIMLKSRFKIEPHAKTSIVYSPLCGTGAYLLPLALNELGFKNLNLVKQEMVTDPEFANITSPNPESEGATKRSLDLLLQTKADIALITDPDADRIGLIIYHHGKAIRPNGNQIAAIILDYLICQDHDVKNKIVVSSFVTTKLLEAMCKKHGLVHKTVLTGFKYIGQIIEDLENSAKQDMFLLGAEESYGYLIGTHAKDKDAIITSVALAKACEKAKHEGKTLYDKLLELYKEYGLFIETTLTIDFPLGTTSDTIKNKLKPMKDHPPIQFGDEKITHMCDFNTQTKLDVLSKDKSPIAIPATDAIEFDTQSSWLMIRPSGTEPKLKIYAGRKIQVQENIELAKDSQEAKLAKDLEEFCKKHLS